MTKEISARTLSTTKREEYPGVEMLNQIRITRHYIISANRRIPFLLHKKLVQAAQQPWAERHSDSTVGKAGVPGGTKDLHS